MLKWEEVPSTGSNVGNTLGVRRAAVPGGWLVFVVRMLDESGLTFYPDPAYTWDESKSK
jgi:hypothetical protein